MRTRALSVAAALPLVFLLAACDPADDPQPSASYTPSQEQIDALENSLELPDDGVIGLRMTVAAGTGAAMEVTMIVHQAVPATEAADAVAATSAWCAGEVDATLLTDLGYTFTTVEITATETAGTWRTDTPLLVQPQPWENVTLTATGDLEQVPVGSDGDVSPHCATPVRISGPGTGTVLLGIAGDSDGDGDGTPPLGGWAHYVYGLNANFPALGTTDATFTGCAVVISELGASLGAGTAPGWDTHVEAPTYCNVGGTLGDG